MRASSQIFSLVFIFIFALLHFQAIQPKEELKKEPSCARSKCEKQEKEEDKEDCRKNACNPFDPCPTAPCCYLVESFFTCSNSLIVLTRDFPLHNDDRLLDRIGECWHPPESCS